ncbi:MAG: hypothetical protein SGI83_05970 [Bacteroidota bacterium]|nr:hypothetical protein [Bacteroidota bacterium]
MWIVTIIYWLQAFLCPFIIGGVIGYFITDTISVLALVIGAFSGIILAEYIRRKIGLAVFFARIYGPNEKDEKIKKNIK